MARRSLLGTTIRLGAYGAAAVAAAGGLYAARLAATTTLVTPLPEDDPIWSTEIYRRLNTFDNPCMQDKIVKRVPLTRIRPELLETEGALVTELNRGLWGGGGYTPQRLLLARLFRNERTADHLWTRDELAGSDYATGTRHTDHFEVVNKTSDEILFRAGNSPLLEGPRDVDALFEVSAKVDRERGEAVLGLKTVFFDGAKKAETLPMPPPVMLMHFWYARMWLDRASAKIVR